MTTIIKAANAADFLALVPHLAGYTPSNSLVLVPFNGNRTLGVMRIDLPPAGDDHTDVDALAATFVGMICKVSDVDGVTPVVFTDDAFCRDDDITHAPLVRALMRRADTCGLHVADALCLAADGWGSYLDPECPPEGRPRSELARELALPQKRDVSADQNAGLELPHADRAAKERVGDALAAIDTAAQSVCAADQGARTSIAELNPMALAAVCAFDDVPSLFEDALRWDAADLRPYDAAALLWCLSRPSLRDVALSQWNADIVAGDAALEAQLRWQDGEAYPDEIAMRMYGEGPQPDGRRLQRALDLVRALAAVAPRAMRVGPLASAAWLSWALGHSTAAGFYVERAREIDPRHGLTGIVAAFVNAGHLPEWAFERVLPRD